MKLALVLLLLAVAAYVFKNGLPHDAFPKPLPNTDWAGW